MMNFFAIQTRRELADFLGVSYNALTYVLYKKGVESFYYSFSIPKRHGGVRIINAPMKNLAYIQHKLYVALHEYQEKLWDMNSTRTNISHAFQPGKSIITNAQIHRNKRLVINMDLENFFDSFHFGRVCGFFEKNRDFAFSHEVAVSVAQLTCYQGKLPQGASTSPIITNLICQIFDMRLLKLAKKYHVDYTRYADDLTFSSNDKHFITALDSFYEDLSNEISRAGFSINQKKTSCRYKDSRQIVTGLVVNKKLSVDHRYYKQTRAMAHSLYSSGEFVINGEPGTIRQLEGRFSFINQLDKYNNILDTKRHKVFDLNGREQQYQMFLFYRYFYANEKPIIVTEGKTDIRYIKSALKSLYRNYPSLVKRREDGAFDFEISFLTRSKRLEFLLGFNLDGADAIKNLAKFFFDHKENDVFPNCYKSLYTLSKKRPAKPVIFLFDNEIDSNAKKPIKSFATYTKLSDEKMGELKNNLWTRVFAGENLYVLTNPLVDNTNESEIENLFDETTRGRIISGKKLSLKNDFDSSKYYGKDQFSRYIQHHYDDIDFKLFRPLLNGIVHIIGNYAISKE